jgi:hypothetical protein
MKHLRRLLNESLFAAIAYLATCRLSNGRPSAGVARPANDVGTAA